MSHKLKAARLKKKDRQVIAGAIFAHQTKPASGPRQVDLHCVLPARQRCWDADALWKSLLDGLTAAGMLMDDSPRWTRLGQVTYSRAMDSMAGTFIILQDLP